MRCKCGNKLEISHKRKNGDVVYKTTCRTCRGRTINVEAQKRYRKQYYQLNKERELVKGKRWRENNPDKVKQYNIASRNIRNNYCKKRLKYDIDYRIVKYLRIRLYNALKNNQKHGSAVRDLGCSIEEFKRHLELKFQPGMSWDNYGQWHIDHVKPLSKFNLSSPEELKKACHYSNLQPMWAKDNLSKGSKYKDHKQKKRW